MYHERHISLYTPENNHSVNDWYMESERFELCDQINNAKFSLTTECFNSFNTISVQVKKNVKG